MSTLLVVALASGLGIFTYAAIFSSAKGPIEWGLYIVASALWILFISWHLLQVIQWRRRMTTPSSLDSTQLQVTGLDTPLSYEMIERVFTNPGLPFFVIEKRMPAAPRYVVIQKDHVADYEAFLAALGRKVTVSDTTLTDIRASHRRTR